MNSVFLNRSSLVLAIVGLISVTSALAVDFPGAGGDIASADDWGGALPGASETAVFANPGVYTASTDVVFSNVQITAGTATFDFSETPNRIVSITDKEALNSGASFVLGNKTDLTFKKGVWYSSSTSSQGMACLGTSLAQSSNTLVVDGACITNFNCFHVGSNISVNNRLVLTNNAVLHCGQLLLARTQRQKGHGHSMEMTSGARLLTDNFVTDFYGTKDVETGHNSFVASGNETLVEVANNFSVGNRHDGNILRFTDGAKLKAKTLQYGRYSSQGTSPGSSGNVLTFDDGATADVSGNCNVGYETVNSSLVVSNAASSLSVGGEVTIGYSEGADNNTLVVCDGATLTAKKTVLVGKASANNALIVSNAAAFKVTGALTVGETASATGNVFAVYGAFAAEDFSLGNVNFGGGSFNRIVFSDGFTFVNNTDFYWNVDTSNNVLRVENEASYTVKNAWLGEKAEGRDNRVEIGAGASLTAYRFHTTAIGNGLVISNGTFVGTSKSATGIGDVNIAPGHVSVAPTNNYLRLEGNCPAVRFTAANNAGLRVCSNSWIEVAVPAGGYVAGHVPITGGKFTMDATCDLRLELDDYLAALGDEKGSVTLVDADGAITVPDEVLARANARLPERCRLVVVQKPDYKLVLETKANKGLLLLVR